MTHREDVGLGLFLVGMGLGMALMFFVTLGNGLAFYQALFAPAPTTEATPLLGYVLEGSILLSFVMTVAGIACFSFGPATAATPVPARGSRERGRRAPAPHRPARRHPRPGRPSAPHGST